MSEQIVLNPRILDKIDELADDDRIRQFLKEILGVELDSFESGDMRYHDKYLGCIDKYSPGSQG